MRMLERFLMWALFNLKRRSMVLMDEESEYQVSYWSEDEDSRTAVISAFLVVNCSIVPIMVPDNTVWHFVPHELRRELHARGVGDATF